MGLRPFHLGSRLHPQLSPQLHPKSAHVHYLMGPEFHNTKTPGTCPQGLQPWLLPGVPTLIVLSHTFTCHMDFTTKLRYPLSAVSICLPELVSVVSVA